MPKEKKIITAPLFHEERLYNMGHTLIGGMDEVGRGSIAGPVVACLVIMPRGVQIPGVTDSKKLTPAERERLAAKIKAAAIDYITGFCGNDLIDNIGIQPATFQAMYLALNGIGIKPDALLIDGKPLKHKFPPEIPCHYVIRGDSASHSIAAASIIAKVERDKYMREMHEVYPAYGFNGHKGYGTEPHYDAIRQHGACPLHRKTFLKKLEGAK